MRLRGHQARRCVQSFEDQSIKTARVANLEKVMTIKTWPHLLPVEWGLALVEKYCLLFLRWRRRRLWRSPWSSPWSFSAASRRAPSTRSPAPPPPCPASTSPWEGRSCLENPVGNPMWKLACRRSMSIITCLSGWWRSPPLPFLRPEINQLCSTHKRPNAVIRSSQD